MLLNLAKKQRTNKQVEYCKRRKKEMIFSEGTKECTLIHGNGILRPTFYMAPEKTVRPYTLKLDRHKGLIRQHTSFVDQGYIGKYQALGMHQRSLGAGDFTDFKTFAQYASERLPKIAQEVVLPPTNFPQDMPDNEIEQTLKYRERCLQVVDWEATQKEICQNFYQDFIAYTTTEIAKGERVLIPRKNKFSTEEIKELHALVSPLNL